MYLVYQLTFENGQTYIGSTNDLEKRLYNHKSDSKKEKIKNRKLYQCMRECPNFTHEVLVEENCNKTVARQLEQRFIEIHNPTLNDKRAFRTEEQGKEYKKEWAQQNKEKIALQQKEWREQNKEKRAIYSKERHKKFYQQNKEQMELKRKEPIKCECGSIVRKRDIARHKKTKKHIKIMAELKSV